MSTVITRSEMIESLKADAYEVIAENMQAPPDFITGIFQMKNSDKAYEKSTSVLGLGLMDETEEGDPVGKDSTEEGYTTLAKMRTFTKQIQITEQSLKDDKKGQFARLREWGEHYAESYHRTRNTHAANIFNKGGLTAGHSVFNNTIPNAVLDDPTGDLIYDGKPLFTFSGNNHPLKGNDTVTKYNAVALSFGEANLQTVWTLMTDTNAVNERGERITLRPDTLMVHPSDEIEARKQIVNVNPTKSSEVNPLQGALRLIVNPFLTNPDAWFLIDSKVDQLRFYDRSLPQIEVFFDADNLTYKITSWVRFGTMVKNWRGLVGSNVPTS